MKIIKRPYHTLYISDLTYAAIEKNLPEPGRLEYHYTPQELKGILSDEQRKYLNLYVKLAGRNNLGILDAHGGITKEGEWVFSDRQNKKRMPVQSWVRRREHKHHVLVLLVCNPKCAEIRTNSAALVYPSRDVGITDFGETRRTSQFTDNPFNLWVPNVGFVDSNVVEYETEHLRERLASEGKI